MFLADDAPHSFRLFHESNGDESVRVSPWEEIDDVRSVRRITFRTMINPGSSSNPLHSTPRHPSDRTNKNHNNGNNNDNAISIPLNVIISQSLVKRPETYILGCEFAFDFHSHHGGDDDDNGYDRYTTPPSNQSTGVGGGGGGGGGMGKRIGSGLSQYFMSNVVKGTTVNVSVILRECGDDDAGMNSGYATNTTIATNGARGHDIGNANDGGDAIENSTRFCHDGTLSCLAHPLLLPSSDGIFCGRAGTGGRDARVGSNTNDDDDPSSVRASGTGKEGPSRIGASLLSAIRARNATCCIDVDGHVVVDAPDPSIVGGPNDDPPGGPTLDDSCSSKLPRAGPEDVLRCSSIGSLRYKHASSSFDLSRTPSIVAMRRMILEGEDHAVVVPIVPSSQRRTTTTSSSSTSRRPHGLSMRIEMEVVGGGGGGSWTVPSTSSNTSSLSSSFSRSASLLIIDDRIRRGLRKRVSRSWISWAESWCMRLWEDDEASRAGRRALRIGYPRRDISSRRSRVNVRPSVRRIGDPIVMSSDATKSTVVAVAAPQKYAWEKLHPGGDDACRWIVRWMSSDQEGECGVEVTCTMRTVPAFRRQVRSPSQARVQRQLRRRESCPGTLRKRFSVCTLGGTP